MSAYIVDRHHIVYLVRAALSSKITRDREFTWYYDGSRCTLRKGEMEDFERVANMLWQENVRSVMHRYPDCYGDPSNLPGPKGEGFRITREDNSVWLQFDPIQVYKSCDCYKYQSCEHPAWKASEASCFIEHLRAAAIHSMPAWEEAKWGAPEPDLKKGEANESHDCKTV